MMQHSKSGGNIALFAVFLLAAIVLVAGWIVVRDERARLTYGQQRTNAAWSDALICLKQRNALMQLSARLLLRKGGYDAVTLRTIRQKIREENRWIVPEIPNGHLVAAEGVLGEYTEDMLKLLSYSLSDDQPPPFEKLADLLASAENRLALQRNRYNKRARIMQREMETMRGSWTARLFEMPPAVIWKKSDAPQ